MADHLAGQLLDALEPLLTGLPTTGANVFRNRPDDRELAATEVPGLLVFLGAEDVEVTSLEPVHTQRRDQQIRIAIRVAGLGAIDAALNQIRKEVEVAMSAGVSVAGRPVTPIYASMAEPERSGEGEAPVTAAELIYTVTYFTLSNAPDAFA